MRYFLALLLFAYLASPFALAFAQPMDADTINAASPLDQGDKKAGMIRLQVLLDRASASPGWIDGLAGPSTERAISAFEKMRGLEIDGQVDEEVWSLLTKDSADVIQTYEITEEDAGRKLIDDVEPGEYEAMKGLECLCYHRHSEALAEKFHMDEELLKTLNPDADFSKAGQSILVTAPGKRPQLSVAKVVVDKSKSQVFGYDADDKLVYAARAAVGSDQTPSPSGDMEVTSVALDPTYTYDAKKNFGKDEDKIFEIAAGPNGPVGSVWIGLTKPTYGIHGTPHPEKLNTMASHGCVRMTNWDATELAYLVKAGVPVSFRD